MIQVLRENGLNQIDPDSSELLAFQRSLLKSKLVLRSVFVDMYTAILNAEKQFLTARDGIRVEVGAGVSILKSLDSEILISDIKKDEHLDLSLDAAQTHFAESSLKTLIGVNCFHHFPQVDHFFKEMMRVLKPGGGIILVEPYESVLGRFLYARMFKTETFDMNQKQWEQVTEGPMKGANQALSYLVFVRDRAAFEKKYPELEVLVRRPLPLWLRYLVSGGFNFVQLLPSFLFPMLKLVERLTGALSGLVALHVMIVIRKRGDSGS